MEFIELLRSKNPDLTIYDVRDEAFSEYGVVLKGYDTKNIMLEAAKLEAPKEGSLYLASVEDFEKLPIAQKIKEEIFGTLDTQVGYCYGHSNYMNALEWHSCSELNIAVTPLVLILAKRSDTTNGKLDSSCAKVFFVPAGTVIEVYATTLHFCPCEVNESGFGCVVALPAATNTPLDSPANEPLLFRKNKWIFAHEDNTALLQRGVVAGIHGENYKINY
jgi:hypothetical protein